MNTETTEAPAQRPQTASPTDPQADLHALVASAQTAILATVSVGSSPDASYAPFVADDDLNLYVYVSALSKHTANLRRETPISVMLIEDESTAGSIYARKRATWTSEVTGIERDTPEFNERMAAFKERFGDIMDVLAGMQDFRLFRLSPLEGRLVLGFGAAYRMDGTTVLKQLQGKHRPKS